MIGERTAATRLGGQEVGLGKDKRTTHMVIVSAIMFFPQLEALVSLRGQGRVDDVPLVNESGVDCFPVETRRCNTGNKIPKS